MEIPIYTKNNISLKKSDTSSKIIRPSNPGPHHSTSCCIRVRSLLVDDMRLWYVENITPSLTPTVSESSLVQGSLFKA
jgi:hypothetical protein